jgi:hydrogenase nickel incorporation protein HypA/HybF
MHELGVTKNIVEAVLKHAKAAGASEVISVNLLVGDMRNLEEVWLTRYFQRIAKGTIAQNAQINITYVPIAFYCNTCHATFTLDVHSNRKMFCPECQSDQFSMITGKELTIQSLELDYETPCAPKESACVEGQEACI